jgi:hypothetical protein
MTKAEKILEKHLKLNDVETMLGKHGTTHKAVINAINEAINYTYCCETFKDKKVISFDLWCDIKNIHHSFDEYYLWGTTLIEYEIVLKMYESFVQNL